MNNVRPGMRVVVKPTHKVDLGEDPPAGTVIECLMGGRRLRILWTNGRISSHTIDSPYMWRFNIG